MDTEAVTIAGEAVAVAGAGAVTIAGETDPVTGATDTIAETGKVTRQLFHNMARFIRDRTRSRLCRNRNKSYNRRAGRRLFHRMIRFIRSRAKNRNRGAPGLRTLPGHMTGLVTAPADTRKRLGHGDQTRGK